MLERHGAVPLPPYIEHASRISTMKRATRLFTRLRPAPWPLRLRVCTSTQPMLDALARAASRSRTSRCTWARARSSPVRSERARARDAQRVVRRAAGDRRRDRSRRARGGRVLAVGTTTLRALEARRYPRPYPSPAGRGDEKTPHFPPRAEERRDQSPRTPRPAPRRAGPVRAGRAKRIFSSCRAIVFGWSTGCSPTSIYRNRRCSCSCRHSAASRTSGGVSPRDRPALPLLQLRRRHADRKGSAV